MNKINEMNIENYKSVKRFALTKNRERTEHRAYWVGFITRAKTTCNIVYHKYYNYYNRNQGTGNSCSNMRYSYYFPIYFSCNGQFGSN